MPPDDWRPGPTEWQEPRRAGWSAGLIVLLSVLGLALLAGVGFVIGRSGAMSLSDLGSAGPGPMPTPGDAYFYDTVTKTYFTDDATRIAPIESPDGNPAVRAHFFTCGTCTDATADEGGERFLGYFEKYDLAVKRKIESSSRSMHFYEEVFKGRYYCMPNSDPTVESNWVSADTPDGFEIAQTLQDRCPPRKLRYCPP